MIIAALAMFASVGAVLISPLLRIREIDAGDVGGRSRDDGRRAGG